MPEPHWVMLPEPNKSILLCKSETHGPTQKARGTEAGTDWIMTMLSLWYKRHCRALPLNASQLTTRATILSEELLYASRLLGYLVGGKSTTFLVLELGK